MSKLALFNLYRGIKRKYREIYHDIYRQTHWVIPSIYGDNVKAFWWNAVPNFGDLFTPVLLEYYNLNPVFAVPEKSLVVSAGSILDLLPENYSGYILGSGLLKDQAKSFPNARILAVRGELTRQLIDAPKTTTLGDPGLLASKLIDFHPDKRYLLGIVPHYTEKNDRRLVNFAKNYSRDVTIIDVQNHPKKVISAIHQCEFIASTSLHGLVVADSLKIPRTWIVLSASKPQREFKFYDYVSSFREQICPEVFIGDEKINALVSKMQKVSSEIDEKIDKLDRTFNNFKDQITN